MTFTAVYIEAPEGGVIAYVEELPDVHAQGETLAEARSALRDAIRFWSDESRRAGARSNNIGRASQFDITKNVEATLKILLQSASD